MSLFSSHVSGAKPHVAIVGGGVIGLGIGWRLAAAGCMVDLFERDHAGSGASRVAAGMLAAVAETEPGEDALLALNRLSQASWPAFARELEAASGLAVDLRQEGTLTIALNADDVGRLRFTHQLQQRHGLATQWLSGAEVRRREPYLNPAVPAAIFSPDDHQVDNRKVTAALRSAFNHAGGRLHEGVAVTGIDCAGGRAAGVRLGERRHAADTVVLAAGAWSRGIDGLPETARPPVRPIKGQVVTVRMPAAEPLLRHVLWTPGAYLVPRLDGRLIIGATVEEKGFDTSLTAGGVLSLLESAWRALPGLEELPIEEFTVGFRPGSRDDAPILGPVVEPGPLPGLVLATGHHRNGILLIPVTADAVSAYVLTGEVPEAIRPFGLSRFAPRGEA